MRIEHGVGRLGTGMALAGVMGACVALSSGCNAVIGNDSPELADSGVVAAEDSSVPFDATSPSSTYDAGSNPPPEDAGPATDGAQPVPTCAFGQKQCDGACVSIDDPLFGCDPTSCAPCSLDHASATCAGSGCAVNACNAGYADCDQTASNGCETDLSQPGHCGTCNTACGTTSPFCAPTTGSSFACTNECPTSAPTLCGDQCVDLTSSLDNCGTCTDACASEANGVATCTTGHCGFTCNADFHACGSACVSDRSPSTCGSSCSVCPTQANAIATCNGVTCGSACKTNFADCNGAASDGCEANLLSDPTNCGACGTSCDGRACNSGTCAPPPPVDSGPPPVDAAAPPPAPDAGDDAGVAPTSDAATD